MLTGLQLIHSKNPVFAKIPFLVGCISCLLVGRGQLRQALHPFAYSNGYTELQPLPQIVTDRFRQQKQLLLGGRNLLNLLRITFFHMPCQQNADIFSRLLLKSNAPHLLVN
ncbi:hypothetical protein D3C75_594150 [compost metagenome]